MLMFKHLAFLALESPSYFIWNNQVTGTRSFAVVYPAGCKAPLEFPSRPIFLVRGKASNYFGLIDLLPTCNLHGESKTIKSNNPRLYYHMFGLKRTWKGGFIHDWLSALCKYILKNLLPSKLNQVQVNLFSLASDSGIPCHWTQPWPGLEHKGRSGDREQAGLSSLLRCGLGESPVSTQGWQTWAEPK